MENATESAGRHSHLVTLYLIEEVLESGKFGEGQNGFHALLAQARNGERRLSG